MNKQIKFTRTKLSGHTGFSILEVMIGIFIFVVGLLALSALQGALTRSMVDAKVRTTATNIAERMLESQRGFTALASDPAIPLAYNDIVSADTTETIDGVIYTIDMDVRDYYYQLSLDAAGTYAFNETPVSGAIASTYKQVEITVSWNTAQNFRGTEGTDITAASLGTGDIVLTTTIPALVTSASGRVADETTGSTGAPPVTYTPGLNPDIVSLSLGDNKFKESLLPEPDVIRADERVETRFDVITYSQTNAGAQFLRREEFAAVSCDCKLKAPDASVPAHRPVIWAGDEYVRGQHALKPYGVLGNGTQSPLCTVCCRDHHDGGAGTATDPVDHADTAVNTFVPFKPSTERITSGTFRGDHKHYSRPRTGPPVVVTTANGDYVEACRLVRVDGFFRVAQDFRREDLNIFPNDFLDVTNEIDVYSDYVTGAASAYAAATFVDYEVTPPCIGASPCAVPGAPKQGAYDAAIVLDADGNPTQIPSWTILSWTPDQQLRSRGVYIDYLSSDLRYVLANCDPATDDADDAVCKRGDVVLDRTGSVNTLELVPFFDVQMTKLNRWNETPTPNIPVDSTNEPLEDLNAHSRGVISKSADGVSTVVATGHRGNIGFLDTLPIDPIYAAGVTSASLYVQAGTALPPPAGITIAGGLTTTINGQVPMTVTGSGGAQCGQMSPTYSCLVTNPSSPRIEISGYGKNNADRYACSTGTILTKIAGEVTNGANAKAVFDLTGVPAGTTYNIVIQAAPCP